MIDLCRNLLAFRTQACRNGRQPLRHINEQILHGSDLRLLAADANLRAALAAGRFLTLKAKHFVLHTHTLPFQSFPAEYHPTQNGFRLFY